VPLGAPETWEGRRVCSSRPKSPVTPCGVWGVVADPGLPSRVAAAVVDRDLADLLSRRVSCDVR
jgi:hypothetical protein